MKDKYPVVFIIIGLFFLACIVYVGVTYKTPNYKLINAPKIKKEYKLEEINVRKIAFDRNGLFINDVQYDAGHISWFSKVHSRDSVFELDKLKPPFTINKKENNDTLEIIKNEQRYFLLLPDAQKQKK